MKTLNSEGGFEPRSHEIILRNIVLRGGIFEENEDEISMKTTFLEPTKASYEAFCLTIFQ